MSEPNPGTIEVPARRVPVLARPDVLVVGGGAAGLAAAAASACAGAATLLVERFGFLGGTLSAVTLGGLCGMYRHVDGGLRPVAGGAWLELESRLRQHDALGKPRISTMVEGVHGVPYDPERLKLVADEWMAQTKVSVLTNAVLTAVLCEGDRVISVMVETAGGARAIVPRMVIDASGDAEVVMRAGGDVSVTAATTLQSPSAMFRMNAVDQTRFAALSRPALTALLEQAVAAGEPLPRTTIAAFATLTHGEVHLNATRITQPDGQAIDPVDPWARAAAEVEGRRQVYRYANTLTASVPGFSAARVSAIGAALGIRESRRIRGRAELADRDVVECVKQSTRIACCAWPIEDHVPGKRTVWRPLKSGDWYDIPFGALVPYRLVNVLVAGRCLSASHLAQASARISAACLAMGDAAGIAAVLGLESDGRIPDDLGGFVTLLQTRLRAHGAILEPAND